MTSLWIALAVALAGGLAVLATRHPRVYRQSAFHAVGWASAIAFVAAVIWTLASQMTQHAVISAIDAVLDVSRFAAARQAAEGSREPALYVLFGSAALQVYAVVLSWLAGAIERDER